MVSKRHVKSLLAASGMVLASWCVGGVVNAAEPFALTSTTFKDGANGSAALPTHHEARIIPLAASRVFT